MENNMNGTTTTFDEMDEFAIMEKYHRGGEFKKEAAGEMCMMLEKFIGDIISKRYSSYSKDRDDLQQQGFLGILEAIDRYDPNKGRPTTYFGNSIIHYISTFLDNKYRSTTPYYAKHMRLVREAIQNFEMTRTPWTEADICQVTGLSRKQVANALSNSKRLEEKCSLEYEAEVTEAGQKIGIKDPAEIVSDKIVTDALEEALENLDEIDKDIVLARINDELSLMEMSETFGLSVKEIQKRISAINKVLRSDSKLLKALGKKTSDVIHDTSNFISEDDLTIKKKIEGESVDMEVDIDTLL